MPLREWGDPSAPAAVVAHGAGSTADFVARVFARPLAAAGYRLVSWDHRVDDLPEALAAAAADTGARLVGGISLGAHAAVRWASGRRDVDGVLLVMPGWSGPPGAAAELSGQAAHEVARLGREEVLARLEREATGWVARELALAWRSYDAGQLVHALGAAAASSGPTAAQLAAVAAPAGVVALDGDPYHPLASARTWARLLPRAALARVTLVDAGRDRSAIGAAAVSAWRRVALSAPR